MRGVGGPRTPNLSASELGARAVKRQAQIGGAKGPIPAASEEMNQVTDALLELLSKLSRWRV